MSSTKVFQLTLRELVEVFMRRSMHAWMRYVKSTGLTMPQVSTMMRLYYRGSCGISDVSEHLDVTPAAASQLVDGLVQKGLLERVEAEHDRRAKQVSLTTRGRMLIEKGIEKRSEWTTHLAAHLNAEQRAAIVQALQQLTQATRKLEQEE